MCSIYPSRLYWGCWWESAMRHKTYRVFPSSVVLWWKYSYWSLCWSLDRECFLVKDNLAIHHLSVLSYGFNFNAFVLYAAETVEDCQADLRTILQVLPLSFPRLSGCVAWQYLYTIDLPQLAADLPVTAAQDSYGQEGRWAALPSWTSTSDRLDRL